MNESIFRFLYGIANKSVPLDILIVFFAQYSLYILVLYALWMIFIEKDFRRRYYFMSLAVLSVIISSGIVSYTIKYIAYNPRPYLVLENIKTLILPPESSSMPSGHMMFMAPIALTVLYMNRKTGWWFIGTVILMGIARVMVGAHWPLDILAGVALGTLCFYTSKWLLSLGGLKDLPKPVTNM